MADWRAKTVYISAPGDGGWFSGPFRHSEAGFGDMRVELLTPNVLLAPMAGTSIETERRAFFTPDTLASYLQVSDRMIRKWVAEGRLRSYKLDGCRRFEPSDVDSFVAQFRDPGARR